MNIAITDTAKKDRHLSQKEIHERIRKGSGKIFRETSPYNPELYEDDTEYIYRLNDAGVDIIFSITDEKIIVITQKSFHGNAYEDSKFYEYIGETAQEAVKHVNERS